MKEKIKTLVTWLESQPIENWRKSGIDDSRILEFGNYIYNILESSLVISRTDLSHSESFTDPLITKLYSKIYTHDEEQSTSKKENFLDEVLTDIG